MTERIADPTYGYRLEQLLALQAPEPAADFEDFWKTTFAANAAIPLDPAWREVGGEDGPVRIFEVEFNSWDGFRTGGWITIPRDGPVRRGFVVGHGYGGRDRPESVPPMPGAAGIFPCARGFQRSAHPRFPDNSMQHVLCGIASRETYVFRGCVAEIWSAASALLHLVPEAAPRLGYIGGSFGGGIGALALPWDERLHEAFLCVPSFGHHPLRLGLPCLGSGEAVRQHYGRNPGVPDVLTYYDAAVAARFIHARVLTACALADPVVPPPGQFAVFNAIPGARATKELFVLSAGHQSYANEAEESRQLDTAVKRWLAAAAPGPE